MFETITENIINVKNKNINPKLSHEKTFAQNIILLYDILKEIEKEWQNKNINDEKDKNNIDSLFSLLYFELIFLQQLYKLNITNSYNKNTNYSSIDDLINYNKQILSKKIEKFLLFNNEKFRNFELYKNYMENTYKDKKKLKIKYKNNSCLKKRFNNKKTNNKIQIENNKNDSNNNKINYNYNYNYLFDTTSKTSLINKSNNLFKNKKKKEYNILDKKNDSRNFIKINKSNYDININKIIKERIKNLNSINSYKNIKNNKTINNFHKKSDEIQINKSKDNFSNNDNSLFYLSYDEKNTNPIRKVKNIIIKVRNKNMSMDSKNNYLSNKENEYKIQENNKEESKNNDNNNEYKLRSKSGYLFSFYNKKDNFKSNEYNKNNFYYKERETKEILYDCMNQIKKKLNSSNNILKKI